MCELITIPNGDNDITYLASIQDGRISLLEGAVNVVLVFDRIKTNGKMLLQLQTNGKLGKIDIIGKKFLGFTDAKMREQLLKISYMGEHRKKSDAVYQIKFPSQTSTFSLLMYEYNRVPTFEEFKDAFIFKQPYFFKIDGDNVIVLYKNQNKVIPMYDVDTRLYYSYAEFVREWEVVIHTCETGRVTHGEFSTYHDFLGKTDFQFRMLGEDESVVHKVDFKNNTDASRREAVTNTEAIVIDMGNDRSLKDVVGDFWLFSNNALNFMFDKAQGYI